MRSCVIFAGGPVSDLSFIDPEKIIGGGDFVICADSGLKIAEKLGLKPDLIVGDFDSYSETLPEGVETMRCVPEKDDTDTLVALKEAIKRGFGEVRLYGGLGARFDHSFANVQSLVYAYEHGCKMTVCDPDNELTVCGEGEHVFPKREGWYFSLFALTETTVIGRYSGVKYPLEAYHMTIGYPIGVSNEITADSAFLRIDSGLALVISSRK